MNRFALVSFALLSTTATGCIFGVDTTPCGEDCALESDTDFEDTDLPDTDADNTNIDTDVEPSDVDDADTNLTPYVSIISPEPGQTVTLSPENPQLEVEFECFRDDGEPEDCPDDLQCQITSDTSDTIIDNCVSPLLLKTDVLNAQTNFTIEVIPTTTAHLNSSTNVDIEFDLQARLSIGPPGNYAISYPQVLNATCEDSENNIEDCSFTCAWDAEDGEDCDEMTVRLNAIFSLTACAPTEDPDSPFCLPAVTYSFEESEPSWRSISTGEAHSCAILMEDDSLWCWGNNERGQLGTGSTLMSSTPTFIGKGYREVRLGNQHTCAITNEDDIFCWGYNIQNQTHPSSLESEFSSPTAVAPDKTWRSISLGGQHTCAITTENSLYCWGLNNDNQLGSTPTSGLSQVIINGTITEFLSVDAGTYHTCAISNDDGQNVYCWGNPSNGRLNGDPGSGEGPIKVPGAPGLANHATNYITAGGQHTCAIVGAGPEAGNYCWGSNADSQLGRTTLGSTSVGQIATDVTYQSISAGMDHTCAIDENDLLYCWGRQDSDRLGGSTLISPLDNTWSEVSAASEHTCAITTTGALFCWGRQADGRLGNGNTLGNAQEPSPIIFGF